MGAYTIQEKIEAELEKVRRSTGTRFIPRETLICSECGEVQEYMPPYVPTRVHFKKVWLLREHHREGCKNMESEGKVVSMLERSYGGHSDNCGGEKGGYMVRGKKGKDQ